MRRSFLSTLTLLMAATLLFIGCQETVPNIGQNPEPRDRGAVSKSIAMVQHVPQKSEQAKFGIHMDAVAGSTIKPTTIGYIITDGQITIEVAQAELFPSDPAFSKVGFFKLVQIKNGFAAKFKVSDDNYRFLCIGAVDQAYCDRIMKSIQIITR